MTRRRFLLDTLQASSLVGLGGCAPLLEARDAWTGRRSGARGAANYGPLEPPDANGLRLPARFSSRIVARGGDRVAESSSYVWHPAADGGATFPTDDGGWVYVSNCETASGGASALVFDPSGNVVDAYSILHGTSINCAGGPTPWATWLSCEEREEGEVWECDPFQPSQGIVRPALGTFAHEAVAVDPWHGRLYLTEDRGDGLLYRFTPNAYPDLGSGTLEAAEAIGSDPNAIRPLVWHPVPNPNPAGSEMATRHQVPAATIFNRGEGMWRHQHRIYFSTTGDDRIWAIDLFAQELRLVYDPATAVNPIIQNADNVFVTPAGDVFVAEDPGNLEISAITPSGSVLPVLQITGQTGTEVTGPALAPGGDRLYFSSQRGGTEKKGITYEVTGPFLA